MSYFQPSWGPVLKPEHTRALAATKMLVTESTVPNSSSRSVGSIAWGLLLSRTSIRQETGGEAGPLITLGAMPLTAVKGSGTANLLIGINTERFFKLGIQVQAELMILTLSKILNGRVGSKSIPLEQRYGKDAAELGMLLLLNQQNLVPTAALTEAGIKLPHYSDFELPENQTWMFYTDAMYKLGEAMMRKLLESAGVTTDVEETPESLDNSMRNIISELQRRTDLSSKGRGLFAGEMSEYIYTLFTPPKVSWQEVLRYMESGKGRQFAVPTHRRMSRRGPPSMYQGHRWQGSCNVVVIVDTSRSRTSRQIASITAELRAMINRGARVAIAQADATIQDVVEYYGHESDLQVFGRGGTELQPAIDQLDVIMDKVGFSEINQLVIATDGYTDRIDCKDYPTLILLDNDQKSPEDYAMEVSGSDVYISVLELPDSSEDPNADSSGN